MAAAALLRAAWEAMPRAGRDARRAHARDPRLQAGDGARSRRRAARAGAEVRRRRVGERERGVWAAEALAEAGGPELAKLAESPHAVGARSGGGGGRRGDGGEAARRRDAPVVAAAAERVERAELATAAPQIARRWRGCAGPDAVEAQQALLSAAAALKLTAAMPEVRALVDAEPYALRQAAAHALTALKASRRWRACPVRGADAAEAARSRGDEGSDDGEAAHDARDHSRAAVARRRAAYRRQLRRARAQEVLRQACLSSRGAELRVAGRRSAR